MSAFPPPDHATNCACSQLTTPWPCARKTPHCQDGRPAEGQSILPVRHRGHHNSLVTCDVGFDAMGGTVGEDDARDGKGQARTQHAPSLPQSPVLPVGRWKRSDSILDAASRPHANCVVDPALQHHCEVGTRMVCVGVRSKLTASGADDVDEHLHRMRLL
jgi:hypothetical protein